MIKNCKAVFESKFIVPGVDHEENLKIARSYCKDVKRKLVSSSITIDPIQELNKQGESVDAHYLMRFTAWR